MKNPLLLCFLWRNFATSKNNSNNLIAYDYEKISIDTRRSSRNGTLCKRTATRQYSGGGTFYNR